MKDFIVLDEFESERMMCCTAFSKAASAGSDNECYGPAIRRISRRLDDGYAIGNSDKMIKYCPFCCSNKDYKHFGKDRC